MLLCKLKKRLGGILFKTAKLILGGPLTVCPCCGNSLTVTRGPGTDQHASGQNKLECKTCPYQFAIERRYYERKEMKRKEVEDVMGGKDAWANVDKTDGEPDTPSNNLFPFFHLERNANFLFLLPSFFSK